MEIEVSNGDLVDKITILQIKLCKISTPEKRANIQKEFDLLYQKMSAIGVTEKSETFQRLLNINMKLWEIEDQIRVKESKKEFDDAFIDLARSVYVENDKRAAVKREINLQTGSQIIEEKEYVPY